MKYRALVSVVTVNYNGYRFLNTLLDSLFMQDYPNYEIILVDNNSSDGSEEFVKEKYPKVKVVQTKTNLGFAGGNNAAIPYCKGKYIAFINNDTRVDKKWLSSLIKQIESKKALAVGSKILFYLPFISIKVNVSNFSPIELGNSKDNRLLGVMIGSDIEIMDTNYDKKIFGKNCHGEEFIDKRKFHWVANNAEILLPIDTNRKKYRLSFQAATHAVQLNKKVTLSIEGKVIFNDFLKENFTNYYLDLDKEWIDKQLNYVINNVGSTFSKTQGYGRDIGFYELDKGQYNKVKKVDALCGCSFVVGRSTIKEIGLFDKSFFAYYEDTDFFWRLKKAKGDAFYYCPDSIVYHIHTGTSKEWSPFFIFHVERNRLMMLLKNAAWKNFIYEFIRFFAQIYSTIKWRRIPGNSEKVKIYINVVKDFITKIPALINKRYVGTKLES